MTFYLGCDFADTAAVDLLALSLAESMDFPVGVEVSKVNGVTGYR